MAKRIQFSVLCLLVLLFMVFGQTVYAEDYPWPKYEMKDFSTFTEYFEAMIPHLKLQHDPSLPKEAYQHFGEKAFIELKKYLTYENFSVRFNAYRHLATFLREEKALPLRQEMFVSYLGGLGDVDEFIRQNVASRMNTFGSYIFNAEAKKIILSYLESGVNNSHIFKHIILASGLINVKEAVPILKKINDEYSHFALARLGDKKSLSVVLSKFPRKPTVEDMKGPSFFGRLKRLAYTKQPEAIELLRNYLYSNTVVPGGDDYPSQSLAGIAAEALFEIIGLIPSDVYYTYYAKSPRCINRCKEWFKTKYKKNKIPELLLGEIRWWN